MIRVGAIRPLTPLVYRFPRPPSSLPCEGHFLGAQSLSFLQNSDMIIIAGPWLTVLQR